MIFGQKHPQIIRVVQKTVKIINLPYYFSHFIRKNPLFHVDLFSRTFDMESPINIKKNKKAIVIWNVRNSSLPLHCHTDVYLESLKSMLTSCCAPWCPDIPYDTASITHHICPLKKSLKITKVLISLGVFFDRTLFSYGASCY